MPANGFDSLLISARPQFPSRTFALIDWENGRMEFSVGTKQADGIVAHLVHSLDATHMMLTVNRLLSEGLYHFAMVHDSFGVHAGDIDVLNRALQEEFVRIYSEPVLQNFFKELWEAHRDVDLPALPRPATSIFARSSHRLTFLHEQKSNRRTA